MRKKKAKALIEVARLTGYAQGCQDTIEANEHVSWGSGYDAGYAAGIHEHEAAEQADDDEEEGGVHLYRATPDMPVSEALKDPRQGDLFEGYMFEDPPVPYSGPPQSDAAHSFANYAIPHEAFKNHDSGDECTCDACRRLWDLRRDLWD